MPIVKEKLMKLLVQKTMNDNNYRVDEEDYEKA